MQVISRLVLALMFSIGLACCSLSYNQKWNDSLAKAPKPPVDLTGAWIGTWHSDGNGHQGELRCYVTLLDPKTGECQFHYHAVFMGVLSAGYDVRHIVKKTPQGFTFSGNQVLKGLGGGLYHYEGHGTPTEFHSTYNASIDHGTFDLKRP